MLDRYWYGDVARISPEAPVPVVLIQREENRLGGAANVAVNIRRLGASVSLLSVVGRDAAAKNIWQLLRECGIQAELSEDPDMETIVKLRVIGRSQQMLRLDFEKSLTTKFWQVCTNASQNYWICMMSSSFRTTAKAGWRTSLA